MLLFVFTSEGEAINNKYRGLLLQIWVNSRLSAHRMSRRISNFSGSRIFHLYYCYFPRHSLFSSSCVRSSIFMLMRLHEFSAKVCYGKIKRALRGWKQALFHLILPDAGSRRNVNMFHYNNHR